MTDRKIQLFWDWFVLHEDEIRMRLDSARSESVSTIISQGMEKLSSTLGWEIGPGLEREYSLALSLNGDPSNLALATRVVSLAPDLQRWEFHAGKPPKKWDFKFFLHNRHGQKAAIDASKWRYNLIAFNNGEFYDICVLAPDIPKLDEDATVQAIHVVLESILGEEIVLTKFDRLEMKSIYSEDDYENSSEIQDLHDHLICLARGIKRE